MKRSELENFNIESDITISKNGDKFSALLGANPQSGKAGFGKTEMESLEDLRKHLTTEEYSEAKVFKVKVND